MTQRKYKVVRVKFAGSVTDDRDCFLKGRTLENNKYKFVLTFYVFEIGSKGYVYDFVGEFNNTRVGRCNC